MLMSRWRCGKKLITRTEILKQRTNVPSARYADDHVYNGKYYECLFRMPRPLFTHIYGALSCRGIFKVVLDATKTVSIHPRMKINSAPQVMAYGRSYNQADKRCNMSKIAVRETYIAFSEATCEILGEEYLHALQEDDLIRILAINNKQVFPGFVKSWYCHHWS